MELRSIKSADVQDKRVIVRVDFNVPLDPQTGAIEDESRIEAALPTIQYLLDKGAKLILISHLGRPEGEKVESLSLTPVAKRLGELLGKEVKQVSEVIGDKVQAEVDTMKSGEIVMLENIRFHPGEEKNDPELCRQLAALGEIFVNDGFSVSHRAHASTVGIGSILPSYAGLNLIAEYEALLHVLKNAEHPICLIAGGAKIDTKIGIIKKFLKLADSILVGGALANTFLAARGFGVGGSKYEPEKIDVAQEIMLEAKQLGENFCIPRDVIVASELSETADKIDIPVEDVEGDMKIFDIGKVTIERYKEVIMNAKTIIWNGPLGVHEFNRFSHGSKRIAEAILESPGTSVVGGGDTIDFLKRYNYDLKAFDHVSLGGGAMIEFLEGKILPGIKIVMK